MMTLDVQDLQNAVNRLVDQAAQIQRILDQAAASGSATSESNGSDEADRATSPESANLDLPPEIVVPRPAVVAEYLGTHPDLVQIVRDMAAALVEEFGNERSEIELALYQDPEIDDRYLTFYVRIPIYDDTLMPRLEAVSERFDDRRSRGDGWVLITTDHEPIE
jgi:hypothetical protein